MAKNSLSALLDKHVPGWRKGDYMCPMCRMKIHPMAVSRHMLNSHGGFGLPKKSENDSSGKEAQK